MCIADQKGVCLDEFVVRWMDPCMVPVVWVLPFGRGRGCLLGKGVVWGLVSGFVWGRCYCVVVWEVVCVVL